MAGAPLTSVRQGLEGRLGGRQSQRYRGYTRKPVVFGDEEVWAVREEQLVTCGRIISGCGDLEEPKGRIYGKKLTNVPHAF